MSDPGTESPHDAASLLRELHHRVKNNFQIIASLINLKKRSASASRQEDLRFLEEHVMVMAAAHRLVFASGAMMEVDLTDLVVEIAEGLRVIASLPAARLTIQSPGIARAVDLDQAIGIGLYMAVALPLYLDRADTTGSRVLVRLTDNPVSLTIIPQATGRIELDALRQRLLAAYVRQLAATTQEDPVSGASSLSFVPRPGKA